jgi:hypothetical protein
MLLILFAVAAGARMWRFCGESLTNDELSSWFRSSYDHPSEVVILGVAPDVHPPAYQLLLFYVERISQSEEALRLPSILFGALTAPLLAHLALRMRFSTGTACLSALLLALSPFHIWISQLVRPYAMLVFLSTLLGLLTLREAQSVPGGNTGGRIAYVVIGIVIAYTHYFGTLCCFLSSAALLVFGRGRLWSRAFALLPPLSFVPWIPVALSQIRRGSYIENTFAPTLMGAWRAFAGWNSPGMAVLALLVALGFVRLALSRRSAARSILAAWMVLPVLASLLVSILVVPVMTSRNLTVVIPPVALLAGLALDWPASAMARPIAARMSAVLLLLASLTAVRCFVANPERAQFREAAAFYVERVAPMDSCLVVSYAWNDDYIGYYSNARGIGFHSDVRPVPGRSCLDEMTERLACGRYGHVCLIWGHLQPDRGVTAYLDSTCILEDSVELVAAGVRLYRLADGLLGLDGTTSPKVPASRCRASRVPDRSGIPPDVAIGEIEFLP